MLQGCLQIEGLLPPLPTPCSPGTRSPLATPGVGTKLSPSVPQPLCSHSKTHPPSVPPGPALDFPSSSNKPNYPGVFRMELISYKEKKSLCGRGLQDRAPGQEAAAQGSGGWEHRAPSLTLSGCAGGAGGAPGAPAPSHRATGRRRSGRPRPSAPRWAGRGGSAFGWGSRIGGVVIREV